MFKEMFKVGERPGRQPWTTTRALMFLGFVVAAVLFGIVTGWYWVLMATCLTKGPRRSAAWWHFGLWILLFISFLIGGGISRMTSGDGLNCPDGITMSHDCLMDAKLYYSIPYIYHFTALSLCFCVGCFDLVVLFHVTGDIVHSWELKWAPRKLVIYSTAVVEAIIIMIIFAFTVNWQLLDGKDGPKPAGAEDTFYAMVFAIVLTVFGLNLTLGTVYYYMGWLLYRNMPELDDQKNVRVN